MTIETAHDLEGLRTIGRIVGEALRQMQAQVQPGITTGELDDLARSYLTQRRARSAPMLAVNFPRTSCISVNEEAAHGIPGARRILAGDIVKLDVSAELDGYYADAAVTVAVAPNAAQQRLCLAAEAALQAAIAAAQAGQPLWQIGRAAERVARRYGYQIVRALHGHGVGRGLHEAPRNIPHFYNRSATELLPEGVVLAIEPHVAAGEGRIVEMADGWTLRTRDRSPVAAFEHTVVVTKGQALIVTA